MRLIVILSEAKNLPVRSFATAQDDNKSWLSQKLLNQKMARLRLFAAVREKAGLDSLDVQLARPLALRDFLEMISEKYGVNKSVIMNKSLLYAVNGEMRGLDFMVEPSDEVAVLPPLSGG